MAGTRTTAPKPEQNGHAEDAQAAVARLEAENRALQEQAARAAREKGELLIENGRLRGALAEQKQQLQEVLEEQRATGQVLEVISRSPTELQTVLDTIAESAARLCETDRARIALVEGGGTRMVAGRRCVFLVMGWFLRATSERSHWGSMGENSWCELKVRTSEKSFPGRPKEQERLC